MNLTLSSAFDGKLKLSFPGRPGPQNRSVQNLFAKFFSGFEQKEIPSQNHSSGLMGLVFYLADFSSRLSSQAMLSFR